MKRGAVLFDLDDTLYRERRFALSGFAAVARHLEARRGLDAAMVFRLLLASMKESKRASAFQSICSTFGLDPSVVPSLVDVMRAHEPRLRLPRTARRVLGEARAHGPVGILTNGMPAVQRRKVGALGVAPLVDAVVYACEHGSGRGKPEVEPFVALAAQLGAAPGDCVFVGDDPWCDVAGARALGMKTVRVRAGQHRALRVPATGDADAVVDSLADVPVALMWLMQEGRVCA